MTERNASETALSVTILRAAHQLIDGEPKILLDPISVRILDEAARARLQNHPEYYQTPYLAALRSRVLIRSRFAEDRLSAAVRRGVQQFVILGAGMDTFAYRQPAWAAGLRIFELDHSSSQRTKRRKLEECNIPTPPNLEYVETDFEKETVRSALERSHFNFHESAFFSCLGVLMYLTEATVNSILGFVASMPYLSEIVFSFANADSRQPSTIERNAEALGEPWLTKFQPGVLNQRLHGLGFSEITFLTPAMIAERYLHNRRDGLPNVRRGGIFSAKV